MVEELLHGGSHVPADLEVDGDKMILNMGPQHPSTHGVLRLELITDGEIIEECIPHIGYLHRCFEKHAENVNYHMVVPFADRMDYLGSMNNELGYVTGVEKMMGLEVPERVEYIRVLMAEFNRIASHLVAFGTFGADSGAVTPLLYAFRDRELILNLFEQASGGRLLYNYIWIGGVSHDIDDEWGQAATRFCDYFEKKIDEEYDPLLSYNKIFIERCADVGVLSREMAIDMGATGPVLRASGVKFDLRRNDPYSIYDRFDFDIPVGNGRMGQQGDTWDRYYVRIEEMRQSLRIIRQALKDLPDGDVREKYQKNPKVPKGEIYYRTETPRGELGYYLVSNGKKMPERLKVRSPAFCNLNTITELTKGTMVADVIVILGSLDIVLGEIDR